ncbi:MAG TPA: serine hydrolase [Xanthobacteraceae bacterium]|nr:serine hydrolase [Xanthobacteraceae bacterium]
MTTNHLGSRRRSGACAGLVGILAITVAVHPASGRHAAPRHTSHTSQTAQESRHGKNDSTPAPPYAAIVVDANTGTVLHAAQPDELRHPASLTKIMTLYLLFEQLESGKFRLDSQLPVSEHASVQAPTKLGLTPGQTIEVEDAIRGLVTKSANDAAVAVAEAIGGSERDFADIMTLKARAMGMSRTVYRNASGLPNDEQVTTARDQALLGRAIQERFPRYYRYFATPSFTYHGQTMRNHNQLLGRVEGMDGIKTGYTQASGFNLVASVRRNNRHIVSVVMGGTSAGARDARMRTLIEEYIVAAAPQKSLVAEAAAAKVRAAATRPAEERAASVRSHVDSTRAVDTRPTGASGGSAIYSVASQGQSAAWPAPSVAASAISPTVPVAPPATEPASAATTTPTAAIPAPTAKLGTDPIKPIQVKTVKVKLAPTAAALASTQIVVQDAARDRAPLATATSQVAAVEEPKRDLIAEAIRETTPPESAPRHAMPPAPSLHSGWMIQVGAFDVEREARERLSAVQAKAGQILKRASPFTEAVVMGDKTLYRARFAGIQKDQAEAICRQLKRNEITCMTIKN